MNAQARAESASDAENLSLYRAQQSEKKRGTSIIRLPWTRRNRHRYGRKRRGKFGKHAIPSSKKLLTAELIKRRTETEMRKRISTTSC